MFIQNIDELNIDSIIPGEDELKIRINELKKLADSTSHKRFTINNEINNLRAIIRKSNDERVRDFLEKDLITALDEREKLQTDHKEYERESRELSRQKTELRNNIDRTREVYKYLQSAKNEKARIDIRLRLRTEIQKLIEHVKIYPLMEPYKDIEYNIEPGIVRVMISKYIDRMYIKFRGIKHPTSLTCKRYGELQDDGTYLFMM